MKAKDRIKAKREEKKYTLEDVAKYLGVSRQTVHKYESGIITNIPLDNLELLASILGTTPGYLAGWTDNPSPLQSTKDKTDLIEDKSNTATDISPHKIPVLGYISAGQPLYAEEHIESYTYTDRNGGSEYFALRVKGDSMNAAQINDGNIIIVRKQNTIENGEIAVVRIGREDATVKRYKQDGKLVQLIPQSFNPEHQIQIYNTKETEISIIGKVVECKIEF